MNNELKVICDFLVNNDELDELSDNLSQFNIFDVLGITHYEIRHSNTLAWFLEPQGHHGYSDKFFKRFLSRVLNDSDSDISINPSEVELASYLDLTVHREWRNIDLMLVSEKNKLVVFIENKVKAKESKGQLRRYKKIVEKQYPPKGHDAESPEVGYQIIPLFLTIDGDDPSDDGLELGYIPVSFVLILEIIEKLQERFFVSQSEEARGFVSNYLQVIKRLTMQDQELNQLCKSIYRKHRNAIDLIVQYGASSSAFDACKEVLAEHGVTGDGDPVVTGVIQETRGMLFFLPPKLVEVLNETELLRWKHLDKKFPLYCWFASSRKTEGLRLVLEIGPVENYELRKKILDAFNSGEFSVRKDAYLEGKSYSRAYSKRESLSAAFESDDEFGEIKIIAEKLLKNLFRRLESKFDELKCLQGYY